MRRLSDILAEVGDPGFRPELKIRSAMQRPVAKMAVKGGLISVPVHQRPDVTQVIAEPVRRHRAILPAVPGHRLAGDEGRGSERSFAIDPHLLLLARIDDNPGAFEVARNSLCAISSFGRGFAAGLDDQPS